MTLLSVSGDNQQGLPGEALANPFVVEVRDYQRQPIGRSQCDIFRLHRRWIAECRNRNVTDSNGRAVKSTLTLGSKPGTNRVQVSLPGTAPTTVLIHRISKGGL